MDCSVIWWVKIAKSKDNDVVRWSMWKEKVMVDVEHVWEDLCMKAEYVNSVLKGRISWKEQVTEKMASRTTNTWLRSRERAPRSYLLTTGERVAGYKSDSPPLYIASSSLSTLSHECTRWSTKYRIMNLKWLKCFSNHVVMGLDSSQIRSRKSQWYCGPCGDSKM